MIKSKLNDEISVELISILKYRFEANMNRHSNIQWDFVESKLKPNAQALWSLNEMELSGGEPDVVQLGIDENVIYFCDCSIQTPKGRRSLCYDSEALESRKEHKPKDSAVNMALEMGVELLTEFEYRKLQEYGEFDTKTSSWLKTPPSIREKGGAIFGDYRFGSVFVYHNGAESYYAVRGFRALLKV